MSERLAVYYDTRVLAHDTGEGFFEAAASPHLAIAEKHPENDLRLRNMVSVLQHGPIAEALDWHIAPAASRET